MRTAVPQGFADTVEPMRKAHEHLLAALQERGIGVEEYPCLPRGAPEGVAAARAYPIQGILKYHGLADWRWRTAYLPSISVNNDAAYTITLVEFSPALAADEVWINGQMAQGRERERVIQLLDLVRRMAKVSSRARVFSKNVVRGGKAGKGLGTSASASAALAMAALAAVFGPQMAQNKRLLSCTARLLAGSGARSAVGGVALWLSYPGVPHEESFAVRLDERGQLSDLRLLTVPLDSRIGLKTEVAHRDAPKSSLFKCWMYGREAEVLECLEAVQQGDWRTVAQLAELDSIRLHGITMSGSRENKVFAWEPENILLFRLCNELRAEGVPVYFSTDTGPTTVFLTHWENEEHVVQAIDSLGLGVEVIRGRIAGPATLVEVSQAREELNL
ncbi:MAG: GHMP kinase [Anaerolineae bacterium]|nr:GHMP kinase [Anaerolineae bacterium]